MPYLFRRLARRAARYDILDRAYALRECTKRPQDILVELGRKPVARELRRYAEVHCAVLDPHNVGILEPRVEVRLGDTESELDQRILPKLLCGRHGKNP